MKPLNPFVRDMPASGIQKIFEMSHGKPGCIHLEVGQPDFRTPEHILEAIKRAARDGATKYTPAAGFTELREAIAEKVQRMNGIRADAENIVVSPGAVSSIMSALIALTEPGDDILVPDPAWPNYLMQTACVACRAVRYPLDPSQGFQLDLDELERRVTRKTKVLILNTPGNPTGAVYPEKTVEAAIAWAGQHDLYVIGDEVYEEIIFEGEHVSAGRYNGDGRVVTVFGFSKTYAVPGLRIGYAVCEAGLAGLLEKLQQPLVSCPSSVSQLACLAALDGPQEPVREMAAVYRERRDAAIGILKKHDLYRYMPRGAFYLLIDISKTGMDSDEFAVRLLEEQNVAVAPGGTFGETTASYVRVSFTTDTERLIEGMELLCEWIARHS